MTPADERRHLSQMQAAHRPRIHKTSEFLGIMIFFMSCLLDRFIPLSFLRSIPLIVSIGLGSILILTGVWVVRSTIVEMRKYDQPRFPGRPTTNLVTSGPFRWSRNPTYTAVVLLFVPGVGLLLRNLWTVLLTPVALKLFNTLMIQEEEAYLEFTFRERWRAYCFTTPRWI